ncbi:hypothetical protein BN4901_1464 [Citrobacter europaeus]|uniref:Uncharacterized protein n=1 Tax=Citrobacter europaeus TaxID=1914243 RepID=A0ABY0JLJ7_9ENTR|nr:hypothetical protein CIP106467_0180 [Citrobacter europaeus]SBW24046.1 hypothetical protein BN4901_1464 [Citrobacter europaeus]
MSVGAFLYLCGSKYALPFWWCVIGLFGVIWLRDTSPGLMFAG